MIILITIAKTIKSRKEILENKYILNFSCKLIGMQKNTFPLNNWDCMELIILLNTHGKVYF